MIRAWCISLTVGGVVLLVSAIWWGASIYWGNPDMTRQRLWIEFWREYVAIWGLMLAGLGAIKLAIWIDDRDAWIRK